MDSWWPKAGLRKQNGKKTGRSLWLPAEKVKVFHQDFLLANRWRGCKKQEQIAIFRTANDKYQHLWQASLASKFLGPL